MGMGSIITSKLEAFKFILSGSLVIVSHEEMTASLSPLNYTLKLSSHDLKIKTGRYDNLPRSNRKCNLCNRTEIEDENRFVLICLFCVQFKI